MRHQNTLDGSRRWTSGVESLKTSSSIKERVPLNSLKRKIVFPSLTETLGFLTLDSWVSNTSLTSSSFASNWNAIRRKCFRCWRGEKSDVRDSAINRYFMFESYKNFKLLSEIFHSYGSNGVWGKIENENPAHFDECLEIFDFFSKVWTTPNRTRHITRSARWRDMISVWGYQTLTLCVQCDIIEP